MRKLVLSVAVILFGINVIAQEKTYLLFEFMKVAPAQESAYLETESFWENIHDQRVKSGVIMGWQLWRLQPGGENQDYQYVTVQVFDNATKMLQGGGGEDFLTIAKRAFPSMSDQDLLKKADESLKSRELVETFYLEQIDQTKGQFDMALGAVSSINLMKVAPDNYAKYENAESKIFKTEWQNRVDTGRLGSWNLLKVITPTGNALNGGISHVSLDRFKDYYQMVGSGTKLNSIRTEDQYMAFQKALTRREISSYFGVLIKKITNGESIRVTTEVNNNNPIFKDSIIIKNGYQLTLKNKDPKLSQEFKNNIAERFFIVYPKMLQHFNPKASKNITIIFSDEDVDHPAHAMNNEITIFTKFFTRPDREKDLDVIVHEGFHLVQAYKYSENTPSWLVEGIADYVREIYGVSNETSGWSLPKTLDDKGRKYEASYRTTARFLLWIDRKIKKGIVDTLDIKCRKGTYTNAIWKNETGKTIDELWGDYIKNYSL